MREGALTPIVENGAKTDFMYSSEALVIYPLLSTFYSVVLKVRYVDLFVDLLLFLELYFLLKKTRLWLPASLG